MSEYRGEDTASRFAVLDRPMALPGVCSVCGSPNNPVVDFQLQIDFFGVVYMCLICLNSAAEKAGLFEKKGIEVTNNKDALRGFSTFLRSIPEFREAKNELVDLINSLDAIISHILAGTGPNAEVFLTEPESNSRTIVKTDSSTGQDDSTDSLEGPTSIPSSSSNEPALVPEFRV